MLSRITAVHPVRWAGLALVMLAGACGPRGGGPAARSAFEPRCDAASGGPAPCAVPARVGAAEPSAPAEDAQTATATSTGTAPATSADSAEKDREGAKQKAKQAKERQRKLVRLERDLQVSRLRLSKAKLEEQDAEIRAEESLLNAEVQLELAQDRLRDFLEIHKPQRIAWNELGLRRAEDGLTNARQELQQLELMYAQDEFADQTKEIVIDRARRELERAERDLELRRRDSSTLTEVTLPLEQREHELAVQDRERDLARVRRERETTMIDKAIALLNAESEVARLEQELEDLREEIAEAAKEQGSQTEPGPPPQPGNRS